MIDMQMQLDVAKAMGLPNAAIFDNCIIYRNNLTSAMSAAVVNFLTAEGFGILVDWLAANNHDIEIEKKRVKVWYPEAGKISWLFMDYDGISMSLFEATLIAAHKVLCGENHDN